MGSLFSVSQLRTARRRAESCESAAIVSPISTPRFYNGSARASRVLQGGSSLVKLRSTVEDVEEIAARPFHGFHLIGLNSLEVRMVLTVA